MRAYLFVDGGYLRAAAGKRTLAAYGRHAFPKPKQLMALCEASKLFYFDCYPGTTVSSSTDLDADLLISAIKDSERCHLVEGYLTTGKGRRQKGVDVALAVFAQDFALRNVIERAVLLAGDGDFVFLLDSLVRHGTVVSLWADPSSVAPQLKLKADEFLPLDTLSIHNSLSEEDLSVLGAAHLQGKNSNVSNSGTLIDTIRQGSVEYKLYKHNGIHYGYPDRGQALSHASSDFVRAWIADQGNRG